MAKKDSGGGFDTNIFFKDKTSRNERVFQDLNPQAQNAVKRAAQVKADALNPQAQNYMAQVKKWQQAVADGLNPQARSAARNPNYLGNLTPSAGGGSIPGGNGRGINGGSGGASNGLPLVPTAANVPNPFENIYDTLMNTVKGIGAQSLADFDPIRKQIMENYANSSKQIYEPYQNSREGLDQMASNLGVSGNDVYKDYDATLRRIQENTDQSQAMDLSWVDKRKALKSQSMDSLYMNLSNEKAMQMANWQIMLAERLAALQEEALSKSKGGGGRGGGGSGGGSGPYDKLTETATETMDDSSFDWNLYNSLSPQEKSMYMLSYASTSPNPQIKDLSTQYNNLNTRPIAPAPSPLNLSPKFGAPGTWTSPTAAAKQSASNAAMGQKVRGNQLKVIQDLMSKIDQRTGGIVNPTTKRTTQNRSTNTTKIYG